MKEMEPDDLKQIWQTAQQHEAAGERRSVDELFTMLKKSSRNTLHTLHQNVVLEAVVGLGFLVWCGWLSFQQPELRWICYLAILFFSPFYVIYYRNFRQLQAAKQQAGSLREQLQSSLNYWEKMLQLYTRMNMLLLPPFFIFGALLGGHSAGAMQGVQKLLIQNWYITLPAVALATWAMYPLVRWLVYMTYGRHLKKLKAGLLELERHQE